MPHIPRRAAALAMFMLGCGGSTAQGTDTEVGACLQPRCDNPNPSNCACPDDTDGIVSNSPTAPLPDPTTETTGSTSGGETTTSTTGESTTSTTSEGSTTTGETTESTSSEGSTGTGTTGTDTGTDGSTSTT